MSMQLKWQHCPAFSPAPSPKQAQACWLNALSCQHRVKVLLELLKQELWNLFNPQSHLGFFICFCRWSHDSLWSNGLEAGAGGNEEREGPDCGFSSTNICYDPLCSRYKTRPCGWERGSTLGPYPNNLLPWQRGQLRACVEEVPGTSPINISWVWGLQSLKATQGPPPIQPHLIAEGFRSSQAHSIFPKTLVQQENLRLSRDSGALGHSPLGQHPATIITPMSLLHHKINDFTSAPNGGVAGKDSPMSNFMGMFPHVCPENARTGNVFG